MVFVFGLMVDGREGLEQTILIESQAVSNKAFLSDQIQNLCSLKFSNPGKHSFIEKK